ncbi:MAG: hypothetical protein U5K79_05980 [Cyclobacteriaceae bacterium]|nr:hypothetical protein [Cyclobacteriaceae bacterium]
MLHSLATAAFAINPVNPGNRLFLTIGLEQANYHLKNDIYKTQIALWKNGLSTEYLLGGFSSGNVLMKNGLAGVGFISGLYRYSIDNIFHEQLSNSISARIIESVLWQDLEKRQGDMSGYFGLLNGLSGVGLALLSSNYSFFPLSKYDTQYDRIIQ